MSRCKKCQKELPEGEKPGLCYKCKGRIVNNLKKGAVVLASVLGALVLGRFVKTKD